MVQKDIQESSVQSRGNIQQTVLRLARNYDLIPDWWSPDRDAYFRKYWYQEPFLASAVYAIANRNAAFGWELEGLDDTIEYSQNLLQFADFGNGWQQFITKVSIDLLTQDNGAFIEVIRPAKVKLNGKTLPAVKQKYEGDFAEWFAIDSKELIPLAEQSYTVFDTPLDLPIGIAHLDSGQCQRTGDDDVPVVYTDRDGKKHFLKWWQVIQLNEMPSPIEKMNGVGYCALSRVFRASHIMQSLSIFNDEKVSGRFNRAIFLTNVDADVINDAIAGNNQDANNSGLIRYSQPIVLDTLKPDTAPAVATINLAEIPDGFDLNTMQNWYIANLALAFGVDYGFLAPLPGKGLGTASQSETMDKQSKGKSSRLFMDSLSNAINFKGILPEAVKFRFVERDPDIEEQEEKQRKTRADRFKIYIETGITTPSIARQIASDYGDIDKLYIDAMGEDDITPVETVSGDESVNAEDAMEAESKYYEQIRQRQKMLFKKQTVFEQAKNVARKAFGKKQTEIPPAMNEETGIALQRYQSQLAELSLAANNREITKGQFVSQLTELVIQSLTAMYSENAGVDPEDFTEQDLANIEDEISVNVESVQSLADDIYGNVYQDTEEEDGTLALMSRLGLWLGSAAFLATLGTLFNPENTENKYEWRMNPVKEHCDSCLALDGQVHTALQWQNFSVAPQSTSLLCFGKYCGCSLVEVSPDTPVMGSLESVPLR